MTLVFVLIAVMYGTCPRLAIADTDAQLLDKWLTRQAQVTSWSADVLQIRKLKSLARPLETKGKVWFTQPNRFRWQLGDPPRTIAVRTTDELMVVYPKLKQAERYPIDGVSDPAWKQVLTLLEVGFPSNKKTFHSRYEMVSGKQVDRVLRFEFRPSASAARKLIETVKMEISALDYTLLSTELVFPDGSTMRNQFSRHILNPTLEEALFSVDLDPGYQVVEPLKR